jgi:DNA-binding PadR family transcriptional regulator
MKSHQSYLRHFSQPPGLILASLADCPKDAVQLRDVIAQTTGLLLEPGILYRAVARLEHCGWIEGFEASGPHRPYRITALGVLALQIATASSHEDQEWIEWNPPFLRAKENIVQIVMWMLCLYPLAWRERYETEMVALLEQHEITLWTVVDLFVGALDARLDPHYRYTRQVLPWRRLQTSWKVLASALVTCWIALIPWFVLSDLGIHPSDASWCYQEWPADYCTMRLAVGAHALPPATVIAATILPLAWSFFPIFLVCLIVWVIGQALTKNAWNWLRLLPIGLSILYYFLGPPLSPWWLNGPFVVSLLLVVESGGAMLICRRRWEHPHSLRLALSVRLIVFLTMVGMISTCISCGIWLVALWGMFPQIELHDAGEQLLLILSLALMVLAILSALFALVRGTFALRGVHAADSKQEPL